MPRTYKCRKCGIVHPPPTGKHCRQGEVESEEETGDVQQHILVTLAALQKQVQEMDVRMREDRQTANTTVAAEAEISSEEEGEPDDQQEGARGGELVAATPDSLRKNIQLMAKAAGRIAQMGDDDRDEEDNGILPNAKSRGMKSGSVMVASDAIRRTIDWPHMHVCRRVNGRRKNMMFNELKPEEFVYGFLIMLKKTRNRMDREVMMPLLEMVMQDAVDYSWSNARDFYETLGLEVEKGQLEWTDTDTIRDYRMNYSRAVFPEKKETKETGKTQPRQATSGMKCCAAFQKHACDLNRDHHPYTHACAYCFKAAGLMCRHPEEDCFRKTSDESKNVKKREA